MVQHTQLVLCAPPCSEVVATNEKELAEAIQDKERFVRLDSHIGLTGTFTSAQVRWFVLQHSLCRPWLRKRENTALPGGCLACALCVC